jgi:eukaryotic-like serine/threonine-protein kinase
VSALFYLWVLMLNRREEAIAQILDFRADVRDTVPARIALFLSRARVGDREGAQSSLSAQVEVAATATDVFSRFLAEGFALAGMPDRAIHWLETAVARGFINYPFLSRYDPLLASLRTHPRFLRLMDIVRARWETFVA